MDPKVRGSEVLLTALPFAHTVGGPLPMEQREKTVECERLCSMALPLFLWSIQAGSRKQKLSQEEPCEAPKLADLFWLPLLFSPELHYIRGDVVLNPQGLGCLPESSLLQLHWLQIHAQGDNGLDGAICQSLELGMRHLTATSV